MSHGLLQSPMFIRAVRKMLNERPDAAQDLRSALRQLEDDPYHPSLRTHRLQGELRHAWACSAGYDLCVLFRFVRHKEKPAILLQTVGTHYEVY
jgi:mRNA interferase YafQ